MSHILVVEDEPAVLALIIQTISRDKRYSVRSANTAAMGLQMGLDMSVPLDLLIVNSMLQRAPGGDLAAKIKSKRPQVPVILIGGKDQARIKLLDEGWQLVEKRYLQEELLGRVRRELRQGRGERAGKASGG